MVLAVLPCRVRVLWIFGRALVSTYVHDASRSTAPLDAPLIALASALTRHGTCTVGTRAASAGDAAASRPPRPSPPRPRFS